MVQRELESQNSGRFWLAPVALVLGLIMIYAGVAMVVKGFKARSQVLVPAYQGQARTDVIDAVRYQFQFRDGRWHLTTGDSEHTVLLPVFLPDPGRLRLPAGFIETDVVRTTLFDALSEAGYRLELAEEQALREISLNGRFPFKEGSAGNRGNRAALPAPQQQTRTLNDILKTLNPDSQSFRVSLEDWRIRVLPDLETAASVRRGQVSYYRLTFANDLVGGETQVDVSGEILTRVRALDFGVRDADKAAYLQVLINQLGGKPVVDGKFGRGSQTALAEALQARFGDQQDITLFLQKLEARF